MLAFLKALHQLAVQLHICSMIDYLDTAVMELYAHEFPLLILKSHLGLKVINDYRVNA